MFEHSLLESRGVPVGRRRWTTAISFATQFVFVAIAVLLPLIYSDALPLGRLMERIVTPVAPPPGEPPQQHAAAQQPRATSSNKELDNVFREPSSIPRTIARGPDSEPAGGGASATCLGCVEGGIPNGVPNSVLNVIRPEAPMPKIAAPAKVRVSSGVAQGLLVHQVKPVYPPLARQARIQGIVVLQAVIAKDGTVIDLRALSGHPLLIPAALDAVRQWRYRPYTLNNEPVEVDTQITVNFTLAGG